MHTEIESDTCNLTNSSHITYTSIRVKTKNYVQDAHTHMRTRTHTNMHAHTMRTHIHTHTLYRRTGVKDSVASLKYLEKRNVLSLLSKEERVAECFFFSFLSLLAVYWHKSGPHVCMYICVYVCAHAYVCMVCVRVRSVHVGGRCGGWRCTCTYVSVCVCMHMCACVCVFVRTLDDFY